jgi:thioredoxin-like negative regulator of GroEL
MLGREQEALAAARAWVKATNSAAASAALGGALELTGPPEEARQASQRAVEMGVAPIFLSGYVRSLARSSRFEEALQVLGTAPLETWPSARVGLLSARTEISLYQGRYGEAIDVLKEMPELVALEDRTGVPARLRTAIYASMGAADRAWGAARPLVEAGGGVDLIPLHLALAGDLPHAAAAARLLVPGSRQLAFYESAVAWRSGRLEAISAGKYAPDQALATELLGELEAGRRQDDAAIRALERFRTAGIYRLPSVEAALRLPRALLLLAEAYDRSGDRGRARERLDELLSLWRRADPDLPMLAEAKALDARLRSGTKRATPR